MTEPTPEPTPEPVPLPEPEPEAGAPLGDAGTTSTRPSRRVDPAGKSALFTTPVKAARDQLAPGNQKEGRDALFSTGPRQTGTVIIECSSCQVRSRATLLDLGIRFASVSAWIPGRRFGHWMRCPGCHHHTWCRVGWTE